MYLTRERVVQNYRQREISACEIALTKCVCVLFRDGIVEAQSAQISWEIRNFND